MNDLTKPQPGDLIPGDLPRIQTICEIPRDLPATYQMHKSQKDPRPKKKSKFLDKKRALATTARA
jgi:hypothetical protein